MGETQSVQEVMRTFAGNFCAQPADIALTCAPQTSDQFLVINFLLVSGFEKASFLSVLARDEGATRFFLFETCCFYVYIMRRTISMCISCDELLVYFYLFFMFSSSSVPGIAIALQTRSGKRQPWQERQQSKLQS